MRHLTRFSLRSLLLVVTVACLFLGYEMNWIHRRRQFNAILSRVGASDNYLASQVNAGAIANSNIYAGPDISGVQVRPPNYLSWFGEKGYGSITVIVPLGDATRLEEKDSITEQYPEPNIG